MAKRNLDDIFYDAPPICQNYVDEILTKKRKTLDLSFLLQSPLITGEIQEELNNNKCPTFKYSENNCENVEITRNDDDDSEPFFINDPRYILNSNGNTRWADNSRVVSFWYMVGLVLKLLDNLFLKSLPRVTARWRLKQRLFDYP